jgi:hypothetical protein
MQVIRGGRFDGGHFEKGCPFIGNFGPVACWQWTPLDQFVIIIVVVVVVFVSPRRSRARCVLDVFGPSAKHVGDHRIAAGPVPSSLVLGQSGRLRLQNLVDGAATQTRRRLVVVRLLVLGQRGEVRVKMGYGLGG